jgi:hypothetical protein
MVALAAFAAGVFWTKTSTPAPQAITAGPVDDQAIAALRKETQLLRGEIAVLSNELTSLRNALQERPAAPGSPTVFPTQEESSDTLAMKPTKDALERYRAATGNQKPANPADLVPYFTDPQQAAAYLKKRDSAAAKPERQQLKAEIRTELKQRLKGGSDVPALP